SGAGAGVQRPRILPPEGRRLEALSALMRASAPERNTNGLTQKNAPGRLAFQGKEKTGSFRRGFPFRFDCLKSET
ncbi:MAG: hypothetical protein SOX97_03160, partial [Sutterella sp.]|nr:hypothetical protein [Sutterella sp.]